MRLREGVRREFSWSGERSFGSQKGFFSLAEHGYLGYLLKYLCPETGWIAQSTSDIWPEWFEFALAVAAPGSSVEAIRTRKNAWQVVISPQYAEAWLGHLSYFIHFGLSRKGIWTIYDHRYDRTPYRLGLPFDRALFEAWKLSRDCHKPEGNASELWLPPYHAKRGFAGAEELSFKWGPTEANAEPLFSVGRSH